MFTDVKTFGVEVGSDANRRRCPLEAAPVSRRDRVRAETFREIKQTARRVLVDQGVDGLALRAVAREMGLTAPALYRYFDSREDLVEHVVADLYGELTDVLEAARDAAGAGDARRPAARDQPRVPRLGDDPPRRVRPAVRQCRRSGVIDPAELHGDGDRPAQLAGQRFGGVFAELVARIYLEQGFPVPADDELDPALQEQLRTWCAKLPVALPLGVMSVFLSCWIRLYGMVCMEVFGHLRFALDDAQPMFEAELRSLGEVLGVGDEYRPPS